MLVPNLRILVLYETLHFEKFGVASNVIIIFLQMLAQKYSNKALLAINLRILFSILLSLHEMLSVFTK